MTSRSEPALRPDPDSLHAKIILEGRVMRLSEMVDDLLKRVGVVEQRLAELEDNGRGVS